MNLKKLSDHELLNTYISGNEDSINVLLNRHRKRILDYIYMMVKNRDVADDIFQETLIKVVRFVQEGRYTENGKFLSWVLRIAHNQVIDYFRQKKQRNNVSEGNAGYDILNNQKFSDHTVEEKLITNQIETDVRKLIDFLPPEQKEVVLMRYYMGLSFKEIAEQTDVSINTALGRMRYALINLRKLIDEKQLILS
ncbi:sigma-70 family RNA polymerase sigma factor [uncultured Alistipes sp.]|uniref:RNA polymerase sigma factor n=1 Tax=uncultured Alistipes sp. TaxID=538949 RepID=UPI00259B1C6F|nr:sigma-70 family RNA polymerase sigma factor [uncultured Alistipes sp.]